MKDKQKDSATSSVRPSVDPITPDYAHEDGEAMDDVKDDEGAMMAAMGLSGFGSTKVSGDPFYFGRLLILFIRASQLQATRKVLPISRRRVHGVNI